MREDLVLEALVDQNLLDCAAGVPGDLVQQGDARGVVVRVRGEDDDGDDEPEYVDRQSSLAAWHLLRRVPAGRGGGAPAAAWTLWVSSTTRVGSSNRRAHSRTWQRRSSWMTWSVPFVSPGGEVVVRRALLGQVMREVGPLAAGPALVEDRVDDLAHRVGALVAADRAVPVLPRSDHRLDQSPLVVR